MPSLLNGDQGAVLFLKKLVDVDNKDGNCVRFLYGTADLGSSQGKETV